MNESKQNHLEIYCPICDKSTIYNEIFVNISDDLKLVFCSNCNMVIRHPNLDEKELNRYYEGYNLRNYNNDLNKTFHVMEKVSKFRFDYIKSILGQIPKNVFEIGPGTGTLMSIFNEQGGDVVGLEADDVAAEWMKKEKNLSIITGTFEAFVKKDDFEKMKGKYDLVVVSHVLEHIPKPNELLKRVRELLVPNMGFLYIEVPNLFKPYSDNFIWQKHYDVSHVHYYAPDYLAHIVGRAGFEAISVSEDMFSPYYPLMGLFKYSSSHGTMLKTFNDIKKVKLRFRIFYLKSKLLRIVYIAKTIIKKILVMLHMRERK